MVTQKHTYTSSKIPPNNNQTVVFPSSPWYAVHDKIVTRGLMHDGSPTMDAAWVCLMLLLVYTATGDPASWGGAQAASWRPRGPRVSFGACLGQCPRQVCASGKVRCNQGCCPRGPRGQSPRFLAVFLASSCYICFAVWVPYPSDLSFL